jgi:membrane fusion protein, type I secretion system
MTRAPQRWPVRRFVFTGLAALIVLIAGFGGWLAMARLSGAVISPGRLTQDRASQVIQHLDGGLVRAVLVREGDRVAANDRLMQLDDREIRSRLANTEAQIYEVSARRARLIAERDDAERVTFGADQTALARRDAAMADILAGQSRQFQARRLSWSQETQTLAKKNAQTATQIAGIDAQLAALGDQLTLLQTQIKDQQALLDRGLTPARTVALLKRDRAILHGQIGALTSRRAGAEIEMSQNDLTRMRARSKQREDAIGLLRDVEFRLTELRGKRRDLDERLQALTIRAPIGGTVLGLGSIAAGSVIKPAMPLMQIVPRDRPFSISTRIAPTNINQLFPGQPVRVRFSTLDQSTETDFEGKISRISADALIDSASGGAFFQVDIELPDKTSQRLSARRDVVPGIPVEVFIRTADQTAWAYLAKPFLIYFSHALRES